MKKVLTLIEPLSIRVCKPNPLFGLVESFQLNCTTIKTSIELLLMSRDQES